MSSDQNEFLVKKICSFLHHHYGNDTYSKSLVPFNSSSEMENNEYVIRKSQIAQEFLRLKEIEMENTQNSEGMTIVLEQSLEHKTK